MRPSLFAALFLGLVVSPLWAANDAPDGGDVTPPSPPAPPAVTPEKPAVAADPALVEAIESIIDEDEATRKKATERLEAATNADIPTLEKYETATDTEIRKQVGLVLMRLRRGEASFVLKYPDGTPAAGQKVNLKLTELVPPPKADDTQKQAQAPNAANGNGGQVQVVVNGNVGVGQMVIVANGVQIVGGVGRSGISLKEVYNGELTADANGKVLVGRYNDGNYQYQIETQDPLPRQSLNGSLELKQGVAPTDLEVRKGCKVIVTVVDSDDKPLPEATVLSVPGAQFKQIQSRASSDMLGLRRMMPCAEADAKGVATLENLLTKDANLLAGLRGYDMGVVESAPLKDGETATFTIKLVKLIPVECKLTAIAVFQTKSPLAKTRILLVPTDSLSKVVGNLGVIGVEAKDIPSYLERGAEDLGTTDDDGILNVKILRERFLLLGFKEADNTVWFTQNYDARTVRDKMTQNFQKAPPRQLVAP